MKVPKLCLRNRQKALMQKRDNSVALACILTRADPLFENFLRKEKKNSVAFKNVLDCCPLAWRKIYR